jgi:peptidyl-prolyl cis-trans isomerase A (cyclophilin A)
MKKFLFFKKITRSRQIIIFFILCIFNFQISLTARAKYINTKENNNDPIILINTNRGNIKVSLYEKNNPELVELFLNNIDSGNYNQLIFHRIIEGFIIQSGKFDENFNNKEIELKNSISFSHSNLKNTYGTLSLIVRKNSAINTLPQFFINLTDNESLNKPEGNYQYEVIGKIISGLDIIEKVAHLKVGQREGMHNVPFYPKEAIINNIKIETTNSK